MIDCFNLCIVVKVDCDEQKSVCTKYGVSGYPTIQWFPKGSLEPQKYAFYCLFSLSRLLIWWMSFVYR